MKSLAIFMTSTNAFYIWVSFLDPVFQVRAAGRAGSRSEKRVFVVNKPFYTPLLDVLPGETECDQLEKKVVVFLHEKFRLVIKYISGRPSDYLSQSAGLKYSKIKKPSEAKTHLHPD